MKKQRLLWIDIMKGLGILSIIFAHTTDQKGVFVYAVPLFFIVSGYLHKPADDFKAFLVKNTRRLYVPYLIFFLLISALHILSTDNMLGTLIGHTKLFLWGGNRLTGDFGTFWFINVLFIGINLFNFMQVKQIPAYVYIALFVLSNYWMFWDFNLPWSIENLPLALCYMYVGSLIKKSFGFADKVRKRASIKKCLIGGGYSRSLNMPPRHLS